MCRPPNAELYVARCQVQDCSEDLSRATAYCRRRHVCKQHMQASEVVMGKELMRFCLQCGRLQPLDCFDADKRSCRATLLKRRSNKPRSTGRRSSSSSSGSSARASRAAAGCRSPPSPAASPYEYDLMAQLAMPECFTTPSASGGSSPLLPATASPFGSLADSLLPAQLPAQPPALDGCWSPWDSCYSSSSDGVFSATYPSLVPPFFPPSPPIMAAAACLGGSAGTDWGTAAALQQQPLAQDVSGDPFEAVLFQLLADELAKALVEASGMRTNSKSTAGRQQQQLARCSSLESHTNGVAQMAVW